MAGCAAAYMVDVIIVPCSCVCVCGRILKFSHQTINMVTLKFTVNPFVWKLLFSVNWCLLMRTCLCCSVYSAWCPSSVGAAQHTVRGVRVVLVLLSIQCVVSE